jgi:hypothetical protein
MINQYKGVLRKGFISYHHPTQAELAFNDFVKPLIEDAVIYLFDTYIKPLASPKGDVEVAKKVRIGRNDEIL